MSKSISKLTYLVELEDDPLVQKKYGCVYTVVEGGREEIRQLELDDFDGSETLNSALDVAIDAVEAHEGVTVSLGDVRQKNYLVATYNKDGTLKDETWYETDEGSGVYSGIVEQTTYAYVRAKLVSKTIQGYWADGSPRGDPVTWQYYQDTGLEEPQVIVKRM